MWTYQGNREEGGQTQGGKMLVRELYDGGRAERVQHNKHRGGIRSHHQYRRPQITGQARDNEENQIKLCPNSCSEMLYTNILHL